MLKPDVLLGHRAYLLAVRILLYSYLVGAYVYVFHQSH